MATGSQFRPRTSKCPSHPYMKGELDESWVPPRGMSPRMRRYTHRIGGATCYFYRTTFQRPGS